MTTIVPFDTINALVLSAVVASVILAFILLVVLFSMRLKGCQEKNTRLKNALDKEREKASLFEESLAEVRIQNASQAEELGQQDEIKEALRKEIGRLEKNLEEAEKKSTQLQKKSVVLEKREAELSKRISDEREHIAQLNEALGQATRRNEFWVEQMTEVRIKYEALKLKVK